MDAELTELAAQISSLPTRGRGRRYPTELRRRIVSVVRQARAERVSSRELEGRLGIPWTTIQRWVRSEPKSRMVPVVVASPSSSPIVLVSPSGWRVEGVSVDELRQWMTG